MARWVGAVLAAAALMGLAACAPTAPVPTAGPSGTPGPGRTDVAPSVSVEPASSPTVLASSGSIAVLGNDRSLTLVDAAGRSTLLSSADQGAIAFPAWSPDGSQIAAIRSGPAGAAVLVFDADRAASGGAVEPVEIFGSSTIGPFYLSWTPDGRTVSFLATEPDGGLALRLAPADGSAPHDGSGPGSTIGTGNPFYFDWIEHDRLLAHVGVGPGALLGEIALDGNTADAAPALDAPGDFRSAVVSPDHGLVSYVRLRVGGTSEVVVAARDGSKEHAIPVFGVAAVAFDPTGDTIATIGAVEPVVSTLALPVGPLRLLDVQSSTDRTLLDGLVLGFWWSPDGRTIAALRVQAVVREARSGTTVAVPGESPQEVRILFVDVASGEIGSESVVRPGQLFIEQLLPYFDQYALSHDLWAPDSSSFLLPVVDADGETRVAVMYRNGDPPAMIDGVIGFWSP